ncbi:MAG: hypothetical protein PHR35_19255 [Kiritimatiellae bacterium]|nr:hypothetical protein [Kiritimatiellia bacterium]
MKLILNILALLCTASVFAENMQVEITRKKPEHDGVHFAVVAEPGKSMDHHSQVSWVVVAVRPLDKNTMAHTAYLEVWDGERFVCSSVLPSCKPSDIPINLQKQIKTEGAVLFSFKINPAFLKRTWFNYQIPRHSAEDEPTDCVIHLEEFMEKPNSLLQGDVLNAAPEECR